MVVIGVDQCPNPECGADLKRGLVPGTQNSIGGPRYYSDVIEVRPPGVVHSALYRKCPECGHCWHKYPESAVYMRGLAEPYIEIENRRRLENAGSAGSAGPPQSQGAPGQDTEGG